MALDLVTVIIAVFNDETTIEDCLNTLARQNYPRYEVIVVDDGSTDRTLDRVRNLVRDDPTFRIISLPMNQGVAAARNRAIREACGDILVFADADCFFNPDWLALLVSPLQKEGTGCAGGPDETPASDSLMQRCIDYSMHSLIASGGLRRGELNLARYSPAGCNIALKMEIIRKIGAFNETLTCRGEDKELDHRIRKAGYEIEYVKRAKVWHRRRKSLPSFFKQMYQSGKARMDILKVAPDAFEFVHVFPALLLVFFSFMCCSFLFLRKNKAYSKLYIIGLHDDGGVRRPAGSGQIERPSGLSHRSCNFSYHPSRVWLGNSHQTF